MNHRFWVERCWDGEWKPVAFVESNSVQYCHGWLDCVESMLPHKSYRLCKRISPSTFKVLREVVAAGQPRTNQAGQSLDEM